MFKKHIFLVLTFLFVFGLCACGERGHTSNAKAIEASQTEMGKEADSNGEQTDKPDMGINEKAVPAETGVVAQAIKKLEKEGKYPELDRSDTLHGTDANNNGIRDDTENYIESLPLDKNQKGALMQNANASNMVFLPDFDETSREEVTKYADAYFKSLRCMRPYFNNNDK